MLAALHTTTSDSNSDHLKRSKTQSTENTTMSYQERQARQEPCHQTSPVRQRQAQEQARRHQSPANPDRYWRWELAQKWSAVRWERRWWRWWAGWTFDRGQRQMTHLLTWQHPQTGLQQAFPSPSAHAASLQTVGQPCHSVRRGLQRVQRRQVCDKQQPRKRGNTQTGAAPRTRLRRRARIHRCDAGRGFGNGSGRGRPDNTAATGGATVIPRPLCFSATDGSGSSEWARSGS